MTDDALPPSVRTVETLARYYDTDPLALPFALEKKIDTDALDALFACKQRVVSVTFTIDGHRVAVTHETVRIDGQEFGGEEY
ncbi:HalOD1 output domain-containing protein [Haloarcula amylovorans]|uniref:HalOD1 output domain-containing protein n=1 Tax=Haloarcula amylovorans TaxID=2562280 RepID=UPI0010767A70|nr:HalOD1 output domain-containing protein [Halomicroarcula amylolytica]